MTVYRHKTGGWTYHFELEKRRILKGGFKTKQEARTAEVEARKKLRGLNVGFLGLCSARLEDLKIRRSHQHYRENQVLFENLMPLWGKKKEVTREDVEARLRETARKSKPLANRELRLIKALFGYGTTRGWLEKNPCQGIERFSESKIRRYTPPIEDVEKVLALANPEQRIYLLVIANTMARVREINRLKWEDVKENHVILRTRKAKCSDLTEREVDLNPTLKDILANIPRKGEYVFINPRTHKNYDYRKKMLGTLCKRAEVKPFTFHCLRHLGASRLMKGGGSITDIQKLLGHQRSTTTDVYLHSIGNLTDLMTRLEIK